MVLAVGSICLLIALTAGAEQKNWKCKKRGPNRTEFCHIYKGGMRELRLEREKLPPVTDTPAYDPWRTPLLWAPLHTPA
jgi:hypothetical protein